MKRETYLILATVLLSISGALFAGEASGAEQPLQVKSIVKNHDARYSDKPEPGPSDQVKVRRDDSVQDSYLAPVIVHIPDQEATDVK